MPYITDECLISDCTQTHLQLRYNKKCVPYLQKNQQSSLKQSLPTPNEKIPVLVPASLISNKKQFIIYSFYNL